MSAHERGRKPALSPDPDALLKVPPAPRHLDAFAREEWRRVLPQLVARRIVTRADLGGLEELCILRGVVRQLEAERAAAGGALDAKRFGIMHRAVQAARQLASEYGLSPTSRTRLGAVEPEGADDDNPLAV